MIKDEGKVELQNRFIMLKAKGFSYTKIANELHLSKGTLTSWNRELESEIAEFRGLQLEELYQEYFMYKESRIKKLGEVLKKIDGEIQKRDLTDIPTEKLLDFQIKYIKELKEEFVESKEDDNRTKMNEIDEISAGCILNEMFMLFLRFRRGEASLEQANKEYSLLMTLLRGYETHVLEKKVDSLREAIGN